MTSKLSVTFYVYIFFLWYLRFLPIYEQSKPRILRSRITRANCTLVVLLESQRQMLTTEICNHTFDANTVQVIDNFFPRLSHRSCLTSSQIRLLFANVDNRDQVGLTKAFPFVSFKRLIGANFYVFSIAYLKTLVLFGSNLGCNLIRL